MFVNRDRELKFLEDHYARDQAELVVLYGRRRVGKTELLRTFCADKPHIFFVADLGTE
jgi:AAA+ ATPase superfamily predicted ATPase